MSLESDIRFETECDDLSVTSPLDIPLSPRSNMLTPCMAPPPDIPLSPSSNIPAPRMHPLYFLKDDLSVFLINNEVIFRVHRHLLDRESTVFRSFPTGTVENPVCLEDTCPEEFVALLEHLYDGVHDDTPKSTHQWTHLLSISDQFEMEKVHKRAIRALESMELDPVDKIVLAVDHNVPEWLDPAYIELCKREDPLLEDEAVKVGLNMTVKLYWAREEIRTQFEKLSASRCQKCNSRSSSDHHCSQCCSYSNGYSYNRTPAAPAAPPTIDEINIGKVVADIFHPQYGQDTKPDGVKKKRKGKKK